MQRKRSGRNYIICIPNLLACEVKIESNEAITHNATLGSVWLILGDIFTTLACHTSSVCMKQGAPCTLNSTVYLACLYWKKNTVGLWCIVIQDHWYSEVRSKGYSISKTNIKSWHEFITFPAKNWIFGFFILLKKLLLIDRCLASHRYYLN